MVNKNNKGINYLLIPQSSVKRSKKNNRLKKKKEEYQKFRGGVFSGVLAGTQCAASTFTTKLAYCSLSAIIGSKWTVTFICDSTEAPGVKAY